jgi:hypothetical protein
VPAITDGEPRLLQLMLSAFIAKHAWRAYDELSDDIFSRRVGHGPTAE